MTIRNPTTFQEEIESIMEMISSEDLDEQDRLEISIGLSNLLLIRINGLQNFIVSEGYTDKDFYRYMDARDNVTYH